MDFQFRNIGATIEVVVGITTTNSKVGRGMVQRLTLHIAVCCAVWFCFAAKLLGTTNFAAAAEHRYRIALAAWHANPGATTSAVAFAEAAFNRGEFALRDAERAEIAEKGIEAARSATSREPANAAAHYWLGMNIGQLARTKMLGALPLIRDIAQAFEKARTLDPSVDHAGPDRSLGLLYRDAPGWPTSVGSKPKARHHLEQAVKIAAAFPENQICLLETYDLWADRSAFLRQLKITEQTVEAARSRYTGEAWSYTWSDWEKRLRQLRAKAEKLRGPGNR